MPNGIGLANCDHRNTGVHSEPRAPPAIIVGATLHVNEEKTDPTSKEGTMQETWLDNNKASS